ncbi:hypothetical protein ACTOB_002783 [Actinoplanes oblitus]|uniref:Uncharacterized protein n=1 Tax=Actinoplanes oblitus TaxID=3040509 RepID=A0ABY8WNU0_9ACTN|nr:hypothetical protein [Actinoplanes oblitus]WIM99142.1 hypothetical protein ACTOB_002783 [Actinoplanes oblitus]
MAETMTLRDALGWTRDVMRQWRHWTRANWRLTVALSVLAFFTGWAWNTYAMAVGLEGSEVTPGDATTATADGHTGNGLFWLILFTMVSAVITYAWTRGWTAFKADVAEFPRRVSAAMSDHPAGAAAMLLWGLAVALVIATAISSAVAAVLALALVALAASPIGVVLNFALIRVWRGLCGIVAPKAGPRVAAMISPFMVMLGEATGLLLDGVIDNWPIKLGLGLVAAAGSVSLVRGGMRPRAAMILAMAGATVAVQALRVRGAYADDGGWLECVTADGRPCSDLGLAGVLAWMRSDGAAHVLTMASIGGVSAALGVLLGLGLGAAAAVAHARTGSDRAGNDPRPRIPRPRPHPGPPPEAHRDRPPPAEAHPDRLSPAEAHPDRPPTAEPHPDRPSPAQAHPDRPPPAQAHPDRPPPGGAHPDRPPHHHAPLPPRQPPLPETPDPPPAAPASSARLDREAPSRPRSGPWPRPDGSGAPPWEAPPGGHHPRPRPDGSGAPPWEVPPGGHLAGTPPHPQPGSGEGGTIYRSATYESADPGLGHVYRSAAAGVHPIPHPPASGPPATGRSPGVDWDDLEDFMPDAPERPEPAGPGDAHRPPADEEAQRRQAGERPGRHRDHDEQRSTDSTPQPDDRPARGRADPGPRYRIRPPVPPQQP